LLSTKKILPFNPNPIVDAYSLYASRFSIQSNYSELKPLLIINHLMLCYYIKDRWLDFNFGGYRSLGYLETDITNELKESNLINYLIDKIDNNSYPLLALDHYFIQNSALYQKQHHMHDIALVYGYDQQAKVIYLADNFDTLYRYRPLQASFDQVVAARRYVENNPPCPERLLAYCLYINLKECYQFNSLDIIRVLNDYLNSRGPLSFRNDQAFTQGEKVFGVGIYNILRNMLDIKSNLMGNIDVRAFHVLTNHKSIILMLIDYLKEQGRLESYDINQQNFKQILDLCIVLRNLLLKAIISDDMKILERAANLLDELRNREITAMNYLLQNIIAD
jgi:hypothetical protein